MIRLTKIAVAMKFASVIVLAQAGAPGYVKDGLDVAVMAITSYGTVRALKDSGVDSRFKVAGLAANACCFAAGSLFGENTMKKWASPIFKTGAVLALADTIYRSWRGYKAVQAMTPAQRILEGSREYQTGLLPEQRVAARDQLIEKSATTAANYGFIWLAPFYSMIAGSLMKKMVRAGASSVARLASVSQ